MGRPEIEKKGQPLLKIDISKPRYDQSTYIGRAKHFFQITNPLNILATPSALEKAKTIVERHKAKLPLPDDLTEEDLWRAKTLYDSAFHPDTGELMNVIGRMSAQMPANMIITGGMMAFYKSNSAVIFWQWVNQSFNALVNYTNRSGHSEISNAQILTWYVSATSGALVTALGLKHLAKKAPPIIGRFVPFAAVAAANCVNIPLMRSHELKEGTPIYDMNGNKIGVSKSAARSGVAQVIFSRILMSAPGMLTVPIVMNALERGTLKTYPMMYFPIELALVGFCFTFATPLACALFKQQAEITFNSLEPELQTALNKAYSSSPPQVMYYNKGL